MANCNITAEGRARGAAKLREIRDGWPKKTTTWEKALSTRRFDEPGMELTFAPDKRPFKLGMAGQ